jgi:hypothetical protein
MVILGSGSLGRLNWIVSSEGQELTITITNIISGKAKATPTKDKASRISLTRFYGNDNVRERGEYVNDNLEQNIGRKECNTSES